jgi:DNA primase large subunit
MEIKDISQNKTPLIGLGKPVISGFSEGNMSDIVGQERIDSLKKAISEIKQLVEERKKLSLEFIKEGEQLKSEITNLILENEGTLRAFGQNEALIEKNALRNKKVEISELQLNEKINCWKDIALLKKELRIYEKELSEKESRISELNDILREDN